MAEDKFKEFEGIDLSTLPDQPQEFEGIDLSLLPDQPLGTETPSTLGAVGRFLTETPEVIEQTGGFVTRGGSFFEDPAVKTLLSLPTRSIEALLTSFKRGKDPREVLAEQERFFRPEDVEPEELEEFEKPQEVHPAIAGLQRSPLLGGATPRKARTREEVAEDLNNLMDFIVDPGVLLGLGKGAAKGLKRLVKKDLKKVISGEKSIEEVAESVNKVISKEGTDVTKTSEAIEKQLQEAEKLRQSPKGRDLLKEDLGKQEAAEAIKPKEELKSLPQRAEAPQKPPLETGAERKPGFLQTAEEKIEIAKGERPKQAPKIPGKQDVLTKKQKSAIKGRITRLNKSGKLNRTDARSVINEVEDRKRFLSKETRIKRIERIRDAGNITEEQASAIINKIETEEPIKLAESLEVKSRKTDLPAKENPNVEVETAGGKRIEIARRSFEEPLEKKIRLRQKRSKTL